MKLLIVSDIHSNLAALDAVLEDIGSYDAAISAGDIVGYGPNPEECVNKLYFKSFKCVQGNHDAAVATLESDWFNEDAQEAIRINRAQLSCEKINWLRTLPSELRLDLASLRIAVFHGSPTEPLTNYIYHDDATRLADGFLAHTGADIIVLGHTHVPYIVERDRKLVINPGSVGQPRDGDPRASYLILETDTMKAENKRVAYCVDETAEAIDAAGIPHRFATRLYRGM